MRTYIFLLFLLVVLFIAPMPLEAQSGRKSPPVAKPSPAVPAANEPTAGLDSNQTAGLDAVPEGGESVEGDTLRIHTSLVTVPVTVMDRNGKYLPDLQRQDFHIFDNGLEQRIAYFATVDQPFTVVLLIDTSGSTHFKMDEIQDAAITFVNQLKAEDRVMVISFDDDIRVLCEPTNNRQDLMRAIRRTRTGGGTRLYDAVEFVLKQKLSKISGRKAVVLFTDGVDTTSRHSSYDSTIRAAEQSDGSVYSVAYDTSRDVAGPGGRSPGGRGGVILNIPFPGSGGGRGGSGGGGSSPGDYRRAGQYLHEIALQSGGQYFRGDTILGLSNAFAQVADELRRQYSIGYYPTPVGQPGQRRQIKVRTNRADLVVKARDSYVYAQPASANQDNNVPPNPPGPPIKHLAGSP